MRRSVNEFQDSDTEKVEKRNEEKQMTINHLYFSLEMTNVNKINAGFSNEKDCVQFSQVSRIIWHYTWDFGQSWIKVSQKQLKGPKDTDIENDHRRLQILKNGQNVVGIRCQANWSFWI